MNEERRTAADEPASGRTATDDQATPPLGVLDVLRSALAAGVGVQSGKNRTRDFTHGKAWVFIAAGIVLTALFVLALVGVVALVLR